MIKQKRGEDSIFETEKRKYFASEERVNDQKVIDLKIIGEDMEIVNLAPN